MHSCIWKGVLWASRIWTSCSFWRKDTDTRLSCSQSHLSPLLLAAGLDCVAGHSLVLNYHNTSPLSWPPPLASSYIVNVTIAAMPCESIKPLWEVIIQHFAESAWIEQSFILYALTLNSFSAETAVCDLFVCPCIRKCIYVCVPHSLANWLSLN